MLLKYFADIRKVTGCEAEPWTPAAPTVRELFAGLARRHGAAFAGRILPCGELSSTVIVLVNGQHIQHLGGLETRLGPDDVVVLFPMVAGG